MSHHAIIPGVSKTGLYTFGSEQDITAQIEHLRVAVLDYHSANASKVEDALQGTDRTLYPIQKPVRPAVTKLVKEYQARLAADRADPARADLNKGGIQKREDRLAAELKAKLDEAEQQAFGHLDKLTTVLEGKLAALRNPTVDNDSTVFALNFLASLEKSTPQHGLPEIIKVLNGVLDDGAAPAELAASLPLWRSLYDRPGTAWTGNAELFEVIRATESLMDGDPNAAILDKRLERAQELRGEIKLFLDVARDPYSRMMLEARDTSAKGGGRYALLPEWDPPTGGLDDMPLEERIANPQPFRRVSITAEKRAADDATRAAQAAAEE